VTIARCDFRLPWTSTVPRGPLSSNTLYCDTGANPLDASLADQIAVVFSLLYDAPTTPFLSPLLTGDAEYNVFDMSDPTPRIPVSFGTLTAGLGSTAIPTEVSATVSYKAVRESGVPRQRRRGRVSLGPLSGDAIDDVTGLLDTAALAQIAENVQSVVDTFALGPLKWVCGSDTFDFADVATITITNECGTIRRRQLAATTSTVITV
jgi:hypothetical protein